jgi:hypothetical protein
MKIYRNTILLLSLFYVSQVVHGQAAFDSIRFFQDTVPLIVTLKTDMTALISGSIKENYQSAIFSSKLADSSVLSEEIRIGIRGHTRRKLCYIPPLRLNFHNTTSPKLYSLNSLKLVGACKGGDYYRQLLLKEYLIYKMYNLLTEKSFRVRLLNITYEDNKGKKKTSAQYGFFVEGIDEMAKRNRCKEWENIKINNESPDREQMTMLAIFQYMIGNTDWSVRAYHNIKLIVSRKDSIAKPYAVPYDFDYSGMVNAYYAVPQPQLGIETVVQRVYRGYPVPWMNYRQH